MKKRAYSPGLILLALWACLGMVAEAAQLGGANGTIRGRVADPQGLPLAGALVSVRPPNSPGGDRFVLTDRLGAFSVANLGRGEYEVRVTKPSFQPAELTGVGLVPGSPQVLAIVLQTAMDFVLQGVRRGSLEDMKDVLRSSQITRPILRQNGGPTPGETPGGPGAEDEPSGHLQFYSSTMEAADGPTDAVGSQFAVTVPLTGGSRVRVEGQYTESREQPRGLGASYEFSSRAGQQSSVAVNVRQGAYYSDSAETGEQREIAVEYLEQLQWSDDIVLQYGATVGRAEGEANRNYMRPEVGAAVLVRPWTTVRATFSRRAPTDNRDPVRGREFFDRAVYLPAEMERFSHVELGITQVLESGLQVSASAFRDELGPQAFLIDGENGQRAFLIVDATGLPSSGVRFVLDQEFEGFDASIAYTFASAFGFGSDVRSPEALPVDASRRAFHVVTARVNGKVELTQTEVTAVYRWAPGHPLAPLDPYQVFAEYNDPSLSLTVAQDIPSGHLFPARIQAVLDARNLFEDSFGSRRTVHASHPRILKGGINFKF